MTTPPQIRREVQAELQSRYAMEEVAEILGPLLLPEG
jgi:hypothetical protein